MGEWCNCIFLSMAAHSRMFCAMDHQHMLLMIIVKIEQYFPICVRISYELTFFSCCVIEVFTLKIAFFLQWKLLYTYWWGEKLMGSWHLLPWPFGEKKNLLRWPQECDFSWVSYCWCSSILYASGQRIYAALGNFPVKDFPPVCFLSIHFLKLFKDSRVAQIQLILNIKVFLMSA